MGTCHKCGTVVTEAVHFRDTCPSCQAFLHSCLNCRLYSPSAPNHCLSRTTEFVRDVEIGNFCEEFEFTSRKSSGEGPTPKSKFDQLFGD
jgi:hypothetical protein